MNILVTGGTGTVGREVSRLLAEKGADFRILTRTPEKAGSRGVPGDFHDPASLAAALRGVDSLFLLTPLAEDEAEQGIAAVRAAKAARVRRVVYLSVHDVEKAPHLPHFQSKIRIRRALEDAGIPFTLIMPNNFFQNDLWFRQAILEHGVYPQPIGSRGVSRVDVRDIGEAAVRALLEPGHEGRAYPLVGPEALTGEDVARDWSRALGRTVRYAGDDLDRWAESSRPWLPEWLIADFREMYRFFQEKGFRASAADFAAQAKILGHAPRAFGPYVHATAAEWNAAEAMVGSPVR